MPVQKSWNHDLIFSLFQQPLASQIVNTEIIDDDGPDLLCWDLTPNGICSSKSAYKLCLQELHNNPRNAPMDIPLDLKDFLKLIWKQKKFAPSCSNFCLETSSEGFAYGHESWPLLCSHLFILL